jgi:hypothetical protein
LRRPWLQEGRRVCGCVMSMMGDDETRAWRFLASDVGDESTGVDYFAGRQFWVGPKSGVITCLTLSFAQSRDAKASEGSGVELVFDTGFRLVKFATELKSSQEDDAKLSKILAKSREYILVYWY